MPRYVPNHFLAELIDISDKYSKYQYKEEDKDFLASVNKLRQIVNKAPIVPHTQEQQVQQVQQEVQQIQTKGHQRHHHGHKHQHHKPQPPTPTPSSATAYFSANLTVNPPTSSTPGFRYSFGGAKFNGSHWEFAVNDTLTVYYNQSAFADAFAPVAFRITGDPATFLDDIRCSVNNMVVLNRTRIRQHGTSASSASGEYEFYIPATCFKQGENKIEFTMTAGVSIIRVRGVSVVSVPGFSDVNEDIDQLNKVFARVGSLNNHIVNRWPHIIRALNEHPQLESLVEQGKALERTSDAIISGLRLSAMNLRVAINSFVELYLPIFIDPKIETGDKLAMLVAMRQSFDSNMPAGIRAVEDFQQHQVSVRNFRKQVQHAATNALGDIRAALEQIDEKIAAQERELDRIHADMRAADFGLAVFNVVASIGELAAGAFLGPYGPFVALAINIFSAAISSFHKAFLISRGILINNVHYRIADLNKERSDVLQKQKEIEQMLGDITQLNEDVDTAATYSQAFADLWTHLDKQFKLIEEELKKMPGPSSPAFDSMVPHFESQLQPYFRGAVAVLDGYIFSF